MVASLKAHYVQCEVKGPEALSCLEKFASGNYQMKIFFFRADPETSVSVPFLFSI